MARISSTCTSVPRYPNWPELDHGRRIIGSDEREFLASRRDRGAGEHGNMATGALPVTWVFRIRGVIVDAEACVATRLVPYSTLFCLIAILEHPNGTIEGVVGIRFNADAGNKSTVILGELRRIRYVGCTRGEFNAVNSGSEGLTPGTSRSGYWLLPHPHPRSCRGIS